MEWSDGKSSSRADRPSIPSFVSATVSRFSPQANNAYVFPALGFAAALTDVSSHR